jgi:hypothetical protein
MTAMKRKYLLVIPSATILFGEASWSTPVQWPGNGHYYELIATPRKWAEACCDASVSTYLGLPGHLATITSSAEGDFIRASFPMELADGYWLGGYQPPESGEPADDWRWVTAEPFSYTEWWTDEPNDYGTCGIEDNLALIARGPATGSWNDAMWCICLPYIVEYESGAYACPSIDLTDCPGVCPPQCGPAPACVDRIDNDGDGCADYPADLGCTSPCDESEAEAECAACSDHIDNDGDGCADYPTDLGCTGPGDESEAEAGCAACADRIDNDGDGCADYPTDRGCTGPSDDSEAEAGCAACADGIDNDGDGCADYPADPGCTEPSDNSESEAGCNECADGIDNDGDGCADYPADLGCWNANDVSEAEAGCAACADGIDNDGDGLTDYPADPGCASPRDDSEGGGGGPGGFRRVPFVNAAGLWICALLMAGAAAWALRRWT